MWYMMCMEKTTLYLPTELHRALKDVSRRTGQPQAALIREALNLYLGQWSKPVPRSLGLGDNPNLSGADTEAWLEAHWQPV